MTRSLRIVTRGLSWRRSELRSAHRRQEVFHRDHLHEQTIFRDIHDGHGFRTSSWQSCVSRAVRFSIFRFAYPVSCIAAKTSVNLLYPDQVVRPA